MRRFCAFVVFFCVCKVARFGSLGPAGPQGLVGPSGPQGVQRPAGLPGGSSRISSTIQENSQKLNSNFFSLFNGKKGLPGRPGMKGSRQGNRGNTGGGIDLLFVMDNSGSIPAADFTKQKNFVSMIIDHALTVGCTTSVRVAVISFAEDSQTNIEFDFNDHSTGSTPRASLKSAVSSISYVGGHATNTKRALQLSHSLINDAGKGARPGAGKIVFVLTDGQSNQGGSPTSAANVLKSTDGATVFAMGVAHFQSSSSQAELQNIATGSGYMLVVDDFDDMDEIAARFGEKPRCNLNDLATNRPEDWNSIIEGFKTLKQNGAINNLAALHDETFDLFGASHSGAGFLPWHRAFLLMIERAIQIARNDNALRLPYWNWADEHVASSAIWQHLGGTQNGDPTDNFCVNSGHFKKSDWHPDPSECIDRRIMVPSSGSSQASQTELNTDRDLNDYETFRATTESDPNRHNWLHVQFGSGSDMASGASPLDPSFYFHHCFIDRLWHDWQKKWGDGPSNYPAAGEVYSLNTPMNQLAATYPGTTTPLLTASNWNRPVNLLKVANLAYTYDESDSIFQGKRRRRQAVSPRQNVYKTVSTSVAALRSAIWYGRKLTAGQVSQLKVDADCKFFKDGMSPAQVWACLRRGTTKGVRLVSGPNQFSGRVEVLENGAWQPICGEGWDNDDAFVTCRQLGFSGGKAVSSPKWSYKHSRTLLTSFRCSGKETFLQDCPYSLLKDGPRTLYYTGYCSNFMYAQIQCTSGVRLGSGSRSGYLQVYDSARQRWGAVCGAKTWGNRQRETACEAAGYGPPHKQSYTHKRPTLPFYQTTNYRCLFSAKKGTDCFAGVEWGRSSCRIPSDRFRLSCGKNVRLVGGRGKHEGRVEIFHRGVWGTICSRGWDKKDAAVVCRQMGYPNGAAAAYKRSTYGYGSGVIWLDIVECTGNEASLDECKHADFGATTCSHNLDAAVKCKSTRYASPYDLKGQPKAGLIGPRGPAGMQ